MRPLTGVFCTEFCRASEIHEPGAMVFSVPSNWSCFFSVANNDKIAIYSLFKVSRHVTSLSSENLQVQDGSFGGGG